jgi:hypothetical protein
MIAIKAYFYINIKQFGIDFQINLDSIISMLYYIVLNWRTVLLVYVL